MRNTIGHQLGDLGYVIPREHEVQKSRKMRDKNIECGNNRSRKGHKMEQQHQEFIVPPAGGEKISRAKEVAKGMASTVYAEAGRPVVQGAFGALGALLVYAGAKWIKLI